MNKFIGLGNITKDLELRTTTSGKSYCSFSIAINEGYGDKQHTSYVSCVAWEKKAENLVNYMGKGKKVLVVGRLQTRSYESGGEKKYVTEIVCEDIEFLSPKGTSASERQPGEPGSIFGEETDFEPLDDDNCPF